MNIIFIYTILLSNLTILCVNENIKHIKLAYLDRQY